MSRALGLVGLTSPHNRSSIHRILTPASHSQVNATGHPTEGDKTLQMAPILGESKATPSDGASFTAGLGRQRPIPIGNLLTLISVSLVYSLPSNGSCPNPLIFPNPIYLVIKSLREWVLPWFSRLILLWCKNSSYLSIYCEYLHSMIWSKAGLEWFV